MKILFSCLCFLIASVSTAQLPKGFVYADEIIDDIQTELRYSSSNNFVGTTIDGYTRNRLIISKEAALALKEVQEELLSRNMCLLVYDGYRPQRAVNHFIRWARDLDDTINKEIFYPKVDKKDLFKEGYIASRSGHSRGSTLDLTIIDGTTNEPLDMGSPYDFFGPISGIFYDAISEKQKENRQILQSVMSKHGFRPYPQEWWHFTLRGEPYPDTYFDFVIK